jgi:hypothetical protein
MNQQSLEIVRKRKADDDDEMIFFIFPALYFHLLGSREKPNEIAPSSTAREELGKF